MVLSLTQAQIEVSTSNLSGVHKAANFTATYELIILKMWNPQRLTTLYASMGEVSMQWIPPPHR
jgi:hypothetical protein